MNLLRRAQGRFRPGREAAMSVLRRATVVASDETGVRIEGSNAYHWVFRSAEAVVHQASPTRGACVVREMMDGQRPVVWISDRYTARQGHATSHQTCLAHLAHDVAYVVEVSDDPVPWRLQLWLNTVFALAERVTEAVDTTWHRSTAAMSRIEIPLSVVAGLALITTDVTDGTDGTDGEKLSHIGPAAAVLRVAGR